MQDLAYDLMDTAGNFSFTYTIANIFLGNFILMNLALAGTYNPTRPAEAHIIHNSPVQRRTGGVDSRCDRLFVQ